MSSFGIKEASTKGSVFASREERGSKYQFRAEMPTSFFSLRSSDMELKTMEMSSVVRRVHILACFGGQLDLIYIAKTRKNPCSRLLPKKGAKTNLCDKWAYISVHVMGDL